MFLTGLRSENKCSDASDSMWAASVLMAEPISGPRSMARKLPTPKARQRISAGVMEGFFLSVVADQPDALAAATEKPLSGSAFLA